MRSIIEDAYRDIIKEILITVEDNKFENPYKIIKRVVNQYPLERREHLMNLFWRNQTFNSFFVITYYKRIWESNILYRLPDDYKWFISSYLKQELHNEFPDEFRPQMGKYAKISWYNSTNFTLGGIIIYIDERFLVFWNYFREEGRIVDKIDGWYKKLKIKIVE